MAIETSTLTIEFHPFGVVELKSAGFVGDFLAFDIYSQKCQKLSFGQDADFLHLFMRIAEAMYRQTSHSFEPYLIISELDGSRLYLLPYREEERERYRDPYIHAFIQYKAVLETVPDLRFSFMGEAGIVDSNDPAFGKDTKKTLPILHGESKESWLEIMERKYGFLKVDLYLFGFQKLHSWGFQAIDRSGNLLPKPNFVRGTPPIPRGADRQRKKRKRRDR